MRWGRVLGTAVGALVLLASPGRAAATTDPPLGSRWTDAAQLDTGQVGVLTSTWTAELVARPEPGIANLRFTHVGEIAFMSEVPCASSPQIPWTSVRMNYTFRHGGTVVLRHTGMRSINVGTAQGHTPTFASCSIVATPPSSFPNARSHVRYSDYAEDMVLAVDAGLLAQSTTIDITVTTNAVPDGSTIRAASITVPGLTFSDLTTTTVKSAAAPGDASTTVPDSVAPIATTVAPVDAENSSTSTSVVTATTEPAQDEAVVRAGTVDTVVPIAATAVALSTLVGGMGAVGAASAVGLMAGRVLSGPGLLPQGAAQGFTGTGAGPSATPSNLETRTGDRAHMQDDGARDSVGLSNEYRQPSDQLPADGTMRGIVPMAGLFSFLVAELQWVSRMRMMRPGIKRITEIAVINPVAALVLQIVPFAAGLALSVDLYGGNRRGAWILVVLVLATVLSPWMAVLGTAGWFVGCLALTASPVLAAAESVAIASGILFVPMVVRSLIGPHGLARRWETVVAWIVGPVSAWLAYGGWADGMSGLSRSFTGAATAVGVPQPGDTTHLYFDVSPAQRAAMTLAAIVVAVLAVAFADGNGEPRFLFEKTRGTDPTTNIRRLFVERSTLQLADPRRHLVLVRQAFAAVLSLLFLRELVGWWSIVLVGVFIAGTQLSKTAGRDLGPKNVHPAVKVVPMTLFGFWMHGQSADAGHVVGPMFGVTVLLVATAFMRTRRVWD